jgi:ketosteroid isomerase-like protein
MKTSKTFVLVLLTIASGISASAQTTKELLLAKETQIYDAIKKHDAKAFDKMATDDLIVVFGTDIISKQDMMRQMSDPKGGQLDNISFENVQAYTPTPGTAIITYTSRRESVDSSGKHIKAEFRESTVFVKKNGTWLSAFHEIGQPINQ